MKLAVALLCVIGVIMALNWGRLPLGNPAGPVDVQRQIFDNAGRTFR